MEAPTMDSRIEEYPSEEGSGKMSWIWKKGVCLGKKVLVACFVASSAPIIVPSLVVASTIVVLSSVPCGLFLAGYACTEKLMRSLLPDTPPPSYGLGVDETGGIKKDEYGFGEFAGEGMEENMYGNGYRQHLDEDEGELGKVGIQSGGATRQDFAEERSFEVNPIVIEVEEKEITVGAVEEAETPIQVTNIAVEIYQRPDILEDEELLRETTGLVESIRDVGKGDEAADTERHPEEGDEKLVRKEEKPMKDIDQNSAGKGGEQMAGEKETQDIGHEEKPTVRVDGKKAAVQQTFGTPEGELDSVSTRSSSGKGTEAASDEVLPYDEEKIWEKIDAMRVIVGYKAVKSTSCIEELKALYIFTGVEPPALFKEESDLVDVSDKLRFLMSVVGIK